MKLFILKTAIVFLFSLLLFRFTIISTINKYESKLTNYTSSSNLAEVKEKLFEHIRENNNKNTILDPEDAKLLSIFIKKILKELNLN
tara:strand:- start:112 stop:372 length:261 start_codon:yes stop_codon:yes gene_type:complete